MLAGTVLDRVSIFKRSGGQHGREDESVYESPETNSITQGEVSEIIKGLNNKSANGTDDVSAKLLKKYEESALSSRTTSMLALPEDNSRTQ
jgi:hypothetical protein